MAYQLGVKSTFTSMNELIWNQPLKPPDARVRLESIGILIRFCGSKMRSSESRTTRDTDRFARLTHLQWNSRQQRHIRATRSHRRHACVCSFTERERVCVCVCVCVYVRERQCVPVWSNATKLLQSGRSFSLSVCLSVSLSVSFSLSHTHKHNTCTTGILRHFLF